MVRWELERSFDMDYIFSRAEMLGWGNNPPKVQVKKYLTLTNGKPVYAWAIEPYEEGCNCPNVVPYTPPISQI